MKMMFGTSARFGRKLSSWGNAAGPFRKPGKSARQNAMGERSFISGMLQKAPGRRPTKYTDGQTERSQPRNGLPEFVSSPKRRVMQLSLVMTVIGEDRPGLVDSVAGIVADHGGNWLESRMSRLGGQFAGILRVH